MFGLFKKKTSAVEEIKIQPDFVTAEIKTSKGNYPPEVLEIHHEFATAADKTLAEAKTIIDEAASKDCSKVSRLEKFGFKQVAQVTELKPLMEKAILSKEQLHLVEYYQQNYPNNKFITEEQVQTICHKYNLVCGDVGRFKGFVPEKNLKDIEKFKLKEKDIKIIGTCWDSGSRCEFSISHEEFKMALDKKIVLGKSKDISIHENVQDERWIHSCDLSILIGKNVPHKYFDRVHKESLKICAPVKDMDISGLELKDGYKLIKKFVPDPVVLEPVNGGYLIVTAWGDEASDELVVNQKMN